jgi:hypothetical protein
MKKEEDRKNKDLVIIPLWKSVLSLTLRFIGACLTTIVLTKIFDIYITPILGTYSRNAEAVAFLILAVIIFWAFWSFPKRR